MAIPGGPQVSCLLQCIYLLPALHMCEQLEATVLSARVIRSFLSLMNITRLLRTWHGRPNTYLSNTDEPEPPCLSSSLTALTHTSSCFTTHQQHTMAHTLIMSARVMMVNLQTDVLRIILVSRSWNGTDALHHTHTALPSHLPQHWAVLSLLLMSSVNITSMCEM